MSFLSRPAPPPKAPASHHAGVLFDDATEPGRYLTDGVNLYRHVGAVSSGMGQMAGLEDCRTLDVILLPIGELHTRRLRRVVPTPPA